MTPVSKKDVEKWLDAWNSHDMERIKDLFTADVIMHQPQNPVPLNRESMAQFFAMLFASYPDIHFASEGVLVEGLEAASWEIVTGTMTGNFRDPATGREIKATGKSFRVPGAMRLRYNEDHKIREVRIYWDRMLLMTQLGLIGQS